MSCSFLVAEVGFEPHDLRVMRCRLSRRSFPQAAFQYFLIHLLGEMERSICFRVHLFHTVLFPYGSSYGSEMTDRKIYRRRALVWVKSMGQFTPRPGTIFGTDIEEQTKEKRFIKNLRLCPLPKNGKIIFIGKYPVACGICRFPKNPHVNQF